MNKELVRKIEDIITEDPRRMNMGVFGDKFTEDLSEAHKRFIPPCGTVACIAGWAVLLGKGSPDLLKKKLTEGQLERFNRLMINAEGLALKLLEITPQQGYKLFYVGHWPERFATAYTYHVGDQAKRAKVVKRVLECALANDGDLV